MVELSMDKIPQKREIRDAADIKQFFYSVL